MTQIFTDEGLCIPVSVIAVQKGNVVTQVKTVDTDGYNAVQVAYDEVADYKITKPEVGHCAKAGVAPMRHLEEFRLAETPAHELGRIFHVDFLELSGILQSAAEHCCDHRKSLAS